MGHTFVKDQDSVRNKVASLRASLSFQGQCNKSMLKKLAVLITDLCKRQLPRCWPCFAQNMLTTWTTASIIFSQREVAIMAFEFLMEKCINTDFNNSLSSNRRQEILSGVRTELPQILMADDRLTHCVTTIASTLETYDEWELGNEFHGI